MNISEAKIWDCWPGVGLGSMDDVCLILELGGIDALRSVVLRCDFFVPVYV